MDRTTSSSPQGMRVADEQAIIAAQRAAYRKAFIEHGDTLRGTHQSDRASLDMRHENLLKDLLPHIGAQATIHDVGCGLCDLYRYMERMGLGPRTDYSGTEIVQEMVDHASQKFPHLTLTNRNFLEASPDERYDFVVLSGTLNLLAGIDGSAWKQMSLALIEKMFAQADKAIAFNFLTAYRTFSDPLLYYFDPKEIFDHCTIRLSRFISLNAAYPQYECTMVVFKKDYLAARYDNSEFSKYFR